MRDCGQSLERREQQRRPKLGGKSRCARRKRYIESLQKKCKSQRIGSVGRVLAEKGHLVFKFFWRGTNALLVMCLAGLLYSAGWEYSVRQYLQGFSDAIVPAAATPQQKVEAILHWMSSGPPRAVAADP